MDMMYIVNYGYHSGSYSTVFSSSSLSIFNNGGFYTWGKFSTSDNQSTVSGSSITYTVAFSTNGANTWTTPQTIVNGTLLNSNTPYMQYNEYFTRTVSTATPIDYSASFNVNYSPPLLSLTSTNSWTGGNTFTGSVTASSMTVTNVSISSGVTFSDGSRQTTAYYVLFSSFIFVDAGYSGGNSLTFVTLPGAAGRWITFTTNGGTRILFGANLQTNDNTLAVTTYDIFIDGVEQNVPMFGGRDSGTNFLEHSDTGMSSILNSGSHTVDIRMKVDNVTYVSYIIFYYLWVKEIQ